MRRRELGARFLGAMTIMPRVDRVHRLRVGGDYWRRDRCRRRFDVAASAERLRRRAQRYL